MGLTSSSMAYSQVIIDENFDGTSGMTPPAGWVNEEIELGGGAWAFDNPGGLTLNSPISNPAAIFDSDNYGYDDMIEEAALVSPSFDASAYTGFIFLEFDHQFINNQDWFDSEYFVEVWNGTDWIEVIYNAIDMPNPEHVVLNITDELDGATDAKVRFRWWGYDGGYWIVDNVKISVIDCLPVSLINASNQTTSSIDLSWDTDGTETEWNIEYGPVGFTPGTGLTATDDDGILGITIQGLNSATSYDFYVQANCGTSTSPWAGPFTTSTAGTCGIYTLTLIDDYGDGWNGAELEVYINGTSYNTYTVPNGFYDAIFTIPMNASDIISTVFVSGNLDDECTYFIDDESNNTVFDGGYSANGPTNLGNISIPTGIQACPNCPTPTDFEVVNSTQNEIELMWTAGGTETSWIIEYGPVGFTIGSGTIVNDTDGIPGTTITGLQNGSYYQFYIQANCGTENSLLINEPIVGVTNGTCDSYILNLYDSYGDGWNDAALEIYINGVLQTTYTLEDGDSIQYVIPTNINDIVSTVFVSGNYDDECYYTIQNQLNDTVYQATQTDFGPIDLGDFSIPSGIQACPTCEAPENLSVSDVDATVATLNWSAGTSTAWNVQWGEAGFTFGTGTIVNTTDTILALSMLDENTLYSFYVQTDCGTESSMWVGPFTFSTYCTPILATDFCEDFEASSMTEACWSVNNQNADNEAWDLSYTNNPNSGSESAVLYTDYNNGLDNDWLITPRLTLTGNEALKFFYRVQSSSEPNTFEVLLSTTGNMPGDFQHVLMSPNSYDNVTYNDTIISLGSYTGNIFIAFHVPNSTDDGWRLYIDDVCIETCTPITPGIDGDSTFCAISGPLDLGTVASVSPNGTWNYDDNSLISGSNIDMSSLSAGTYEVLYIVSSLCTSDTTVATIDLSGASNAGGDGDLSVCKNEPVDLFTGIVGTYDAGGSWYNPSNALLPSSTVTSANFPGQYNYQYITGNGVCPDDTSKIVVTVLSTCDWLSIDEQALEQVSIYPNPSSGFVYIDSKFENGNMNLVVTDVNGRTITIENNTISSDNNVVNLSSVDKGVYFFKLISESAEKVFRIVIQ